MMSDHKDYRLSVKVRNNNILKCIERAGFFHGETVSVAKFCKAHGLSYTKMVDLVALKASPLDRSGMWIPTVVKLCEVLNKMPCELFSEAQLIALETNQFEREVGKFDLIRLSHGMTTLDVEVGDEPENMLELIDEAMGTLTPREAKVIKLRFGLGGENQHTCDQIGAMTDVHDGYTVVGGRVSQIEAKALRKLRHPDRSDTLRVLIDADSLTKEERNEKKERDARNQAIEAEWVDLRIGITRTLASREYLLERVRLEKRTDLLDRTEGYPWAKLFKFRDYRDEIKDDYSCKQRVMLFANQTASEPGDMIARLHKRLDEYGVFSLLDGDTPPVQNSPAAPTPPVKKKSDWDDFKVRINGCIKVELCELGIPIKTGFTLMRLSEEQIEELNVRAAAGLLHCEHLTRAFYESTIASLQQDEREKRLYQVEESRVVAKIHAVEVSAKGLQQILVGVIGPAGPMSHLLAKYIRDGGTPHFRLRASVRMMSKGYGCIDNIVSWDWTDPLPETLVNSDSVPT